MTEGRHRLEDEGDAFSNISTTGMSHATSPTPKKIMAVFFLYIFFRANESSIDVSKISNFSEI